MSTIQFLAYDYARCAPHQPDAWCKKCLRWHELPGQTWGPRTPVAIGRDNSTHEHCDFIEAKEGA
jgi:hypothetical protein